MTRKTTLLLLLISLVLAGAAACSDDRDRGGTTPVEPTPPHVSPDDDEFLKSYDLVLQEAAEMDTADFMERYEPAKPVAELGYDPLAASRMTEISNTLGLSDAQRELLADNGFVVTDHREFPTFEQAYGQLYDDDMPVLITTDSLLYALHRSYDSILKEFELTVLIDELGAMLEKMQAQLAADSRGLTDAQLDAARDVDIYLTVARSLLSDTRMDPELGDPVEVSKILDAAEAQAPTGLNLFGVSGPYDFSQLKPRGHYEDDERLRRYFKAMMWIGRTELPLVVFPEGEAVFNRKAFDAAFLMNHALTDSGADAHWNRINLVIELMVGERDSMDPRDMTAFTAQTGLDGAGKLADKSDEALAEALLESDYGIQRIMSQIIFSNPDQPQIVLPRVFLLLGQRFVIDSYVFHHVTYDRLIDPQTGLKVTRMLPDPLDVQFALGNNAASELLEPELEKYPYQGKLHQVRFLVDSHPQEFWDANLYNGWLNAVRALNDETHRDELPATMKTRAWGHKELNTQMASWAELRHDTILYAKQSYSGGISCEYPDAYVEPYPLFYRRMAHLGELGLNVSSDLDAEGFETARIKEYFSNMAGIMATLEGISQKQLDEEPLSTEEFDFLRGTIERELVGCGEEHFDGWYATLFYSPADLASWKPIIADVHTAPTDEAGNPVGWVLHGATGNPRLMVFTMTDCEGPRAFVGPVSTFHTVVGENFTRYTDSEWAPMSGDAMRPSWTESFVR